MEPQTSPFESWAADPGNATPERLVWRLRVYRLSLYALDIAWPDGKVQTLRHVGTNQFLQITKGSTSLAALPTVTPDGKPGPSTIVADVEPQMTPDPRFASHTATTRPTMARRTASAGN